jgi:hypothetical protein
MSDSFSWKEPYLAALKESDKQKLTELIPRREPYLFAFRNLQAPIIITTNEWI